jgi:hypothetical protein
MFYEHLSALMQMGNIRQFKPLEFDQDLCLSVQAHYAVYCKPRRTLDDLTKYTAWELGLLYKNALTPPKDVPFLGFREEWLELWGGDSVAGYVPTKTVQEIYEYLDHTFALCGSVGYRALPHHRFENRIETKPDLTPTIHINTRIFRSSDE